jgi:hypothetical protein
MWTARSIIATVLWVAALLLSAFLLLSGWLLYAPVVFATGGGGQIVIAILAVVAQSTAAHLVGRQR